MTIKHKRLGKSGVLVSNICLGTMNFGWKTSEETSFSIMDRALELGVNFFDTADVYGGEIASDGRDVVGRTEEIIGRWLGQGGGRREAIVLGTKVYESMALSDRINEPNRDSLCLSALKIRRQCDESLKRLQTDRVDLYQMHHIDRQAPWSEIWEAYGALIDQGKVVYAGSSNFAGWDIATACQEAKQRGRHGLVSEQSVYSLLNRTVELEVIPACRHYGLGLLPWSPLGGGLLAGSLNKKAGDRRDRAELAENVKKHGEQIERFERLCRELGDDPSIVALAWLLHNPVVTAPIIGPRTIEQLESALRATELTLDAQTLKTLDEIFPGPNGEAPQAYAW